MENGNNGDSADSKSIGSIVIVGGCGRVGLPLGAVLASRELPVMLLDIDSSRVESVNSGRMPFREDDPDRLLERVTGTKLVATSDIACLAGADTVIVVLEKPATPLERRKDEILRFFEDNAHRLRDGVVAA